MKKSLALILAIALVFSSFTMAFADTTISADSKSCTDLGMIVGPKEGEPVTADYLATTPTRIQAAVMFLRLKGLEAEAKAFTGEANFADANEAEWAKPIMAYLKANPMLGWQGDGTNFYPTKELTAKEYYKVLLEALGYKQNSAEVVGDFTWDNVIEFAASKQLTKVANATTFTVDNLATATIEALKANVKSGDKTLATQLVENKKLDMSKAVAAGVYTAPADKTGPKVVSITMTNLKEAVIKFDEKLDKTTAETAANYTETTGVPTLGEDGMTVTLDLTVAVAANASDVDFTIKGVKDVAGNKMEDTDMTIKAFDTTIPVADKVELTGPRTFTITFSEPIKTTGTVLVENGVYGASTLVDGNVATVTLGTDLTAGDYKVKVSGFADYAGFQAVAKEFTLKYVKDTTPVTVSVKKATQTYVVLAFNKAVKGDQLTANTFYHTFTAWKPNDVTVNGVTTKAVAQEDGTDLVASNYYKTVRLNFTNYTIPAGTTNLVVLKADGTTTAIVDQWGNKMANDATLALTVTADTTAPTVTKVECKAEDTVVVTFSEDVLKADAETAANYTVKNAEGKTMTGVSAVYTNTDNVYKATLTIAPKLVGGNYTVEVKDIKDIALAANKMAAVTQPFTVTDKTPASLSNAVVVENLGDTKVEYIYITFNEAMATSGAGSILDKANYRLDGAQLADAAKVELFGSASRVKITLPDQAVSLVSATRLTVGQLADASGNKMVALATPVDVKADVAPTVTKVKTVGLNKLEITVNGLLSAVPATGITVTTGTYADYTLAAASFVKDADANETTITATLKAEVAIKTPDQLPTNVKIVDGKITTETGKTMATQTVTTIVDGIGPSFAKVADATANDYTFEVSFDENLVEISSALTATEFVIVDKDGKTLTANVDYQTTINGKDVQITLIGKYANVKYIATKFTVSTKTGITYFGDNINGVANFQIGADNVANAFSGKEVTLK